MTYPSDYKSSVTVNLDDYVKLKVNEAMNPLKRQYEELKRKYENRENIIAQELEEKHGKELQKLRDEIERLQQLLFDSERDYALIRMVMDDLRRKAFIGSIARKTENKFYEVWRRVKNTMTEK